MLRESSTSTTWLDRPPRPHFSRPVGRSTGRARKRKSISGRGDPEEEQQHLLELDPPPVALDRHPEVAHRGPLDPAEPAAVEQVDDDRDQAEGHPPEQHRVEELEHGGRSPRRAGGLLAGAEEQPERRAQGLVGHEADVVVGPAPALAADPVEELDHRRLVRLAEPPGLGEEFFIPLDVAEDRRAVEGQVQLVAVEDLEHQHLVAEEPEPVQALEDGVEVGEQVGDDHDQPAPA